MKKLLFIALTLISTLAFGQNDITRTNPVGSNPANTSTYNKQSVRDANITAVLNLRIPVFSSFSLRNAKDSLGYVMYNSSIGRMGVYKGSGVWDTLSSNNTSSLLNYYTKIQSDARFVPLTSTVTINGTTQDLSAPRTWNVGTVTSVGATAGTGISISGTSPITSSGTFTITNTAPDQTVVLNAGTGISTSGTYPNFTITNTSPSPAGLPDSLAKKANRNFDNVASGAIANIKLANSTISGVSLGSNLNNLNLGYGLTGSSYNGSLVVTAKVDTIDIQSVVNFFPKGDTRYYTKSQADLNYIKNQFDSPQTADFWITGQGTFGGGLNVGNNSIFSGTVGVAGVIANDNTPNGTIGTDSILVKIDGSNNFARISPNAFLTPTGSGSGLSGVVLTTTNQTVGGEKTFSNFAFFDQTIFVGGFAGLGGTNGNVSIGRKLRDSQTAYTTYSTNSSGMWQNGLKPGSNNYIIENFNSGLAALTIDSASNAVLVGYTTRPDPNTLFAVNGRSWLNGYTYINGQLAVTQEALFGSGGNSAVQINPGGNPNVVVHGGVGENVNFNVIRQPSGVRWFSGFYGSSGADNFKIHNYQLGTNAIEANVSNNNITLTGALAGTSASFTGGVNLATSSGNVGIGTSSPGQKLVVDGGVSSTYILLRGVSRDMYLGQDGTGAAIYSDGAVPMYFATNGTEKMRITSGGNTLMGTTTDAGFKLDVNGTGRFSGALTSASFLTGTKGKFIEQSTTVPASTTTTIYSLNSGNGGGLVLVTGATAGGDWFFDVVAFTNSNSAAVLSSNNGGAPPARTYSVSVENLRLTVGTALTAVSSVGIGAKY